MDRPYTPLSLSTLAARLAAKIDSSAGEDACHPYTGGKAHKRRGKRGVIWVAVAGHPLRGVVVSSARVALALSPRGDGDWEKPGMEVLHSCGNGGNEVDCHNWRHLRWGTRQENEDDKRIGNSNGGQAAEGEDPPVGEESRCEAPGLDEPWDDEDPPF